MEKEEFDKFFKVETYMEPVNDSPESLWVKCATPKGTNEQLIRIINEQTIDWELLKISEQFVLRTNVDGIVFKIIKKR